MLDNVKKFVLPDTVLTAIRDAVVDRLVERLSGKKRELVLKFHSDGKFRNQLNVALERAVYRFAEEHEDQLFVDAVARNTEFWSLKSVQEAVKEIVIRPSSYLESQFKTLRQTFTEVVPTVKPERIDAAVSFFLRCVSDEVLNIPQLAPIYQVQLQKISVQQGREMISVLKDLNDLQRKALIALLEAPVQQSRQLSINQEELLQPEEDNFQELKAKYFESILQKYEYMDMGGISARVTSKAESRIVSIRMEDVFIPLKAKREGLHSTSFLQRAGRLVRHNGLDEEPDEEIEVEEMKLVAEQESLPMRLGQGRNDPVGVATILGDRKVVVLGHPGSGKTTISKYIAYMIAQGNDEKIGIDLKSYIPIIVKAAEYGKLLNKDNALSFLSYVLGKQYTDDYGTLFEWALKHKRCFIIIDGLDEVPDSALRVRVAAKIEQFVGDHWENRFLVTSRIVGYKGNQLTGNFAHFTLTDLEEEQIIDFLKNWYISVTGKRSPAIERGCEKKAEELWRAIEASEGVKKLAGTPLLLTIIALVNYYGSKLPDRRVELYQLATETLLSNWPLKQREQKIDWKEIVSILEPIAFHIFTTSSDRLITEYEFRPLFEKQVRKFWGTNARKTRIISSQLLDKIEEHTGFFLKRGTNEKGQEVYGFLHPTFAEYLTARYLAQRWVEEHKLEFADAVHEALWHEVVLLMAGHLGTLMDILATRLVEKIEQLGSPFEEYLHRDLLLVAEIIGDNVPVARGKREEIVFSLISLALSTSFEDLFRSIFDRLSDIAKAFPFASQPKPLKHQEGDSVVQRVRKTILTRAIGIRKEADIEVLLSGFFADDRTKEIVEWALRDYESSYEREFDTIYVLIIESGQGINLYGIQKRTAERITQLQLPIFDVKLLLGNAISSESYWRVWLLDLQQLSYSGPSKLASSELVTRREGVVSDALTWDHPSEANFKKRLVEYSKQISSSNAYEDVWVAFHALKHLLDQWDKETKAEPEISHCRSMMQTLLVSVQDTAFRTIALDILFRLTWNVKEQAIILAQGLDDPESEMRSTAAMLAGTITKEKFPELVLDKLKKLLVDPSPQVRYSSARSIITIGSFHEEDITLLLENIFEQSIEHKVRHDLSVLLADLVRLSRKASKPELYNIICTYFKRVIESKVFRDDDFDRLYTIFDNYIIREDLLQFIANLFNTNDVKMRRRAVKVWLSYRREGSLTAQLLSLLKDSDIEVKLAAIEELGTSVPLTKEVIDTLIDALSSDKTKIRLAAMRRFNSIGDTHPEVADMLLMALKEDEPEVASTAALVLSNVKELELRQKVVDEVIRLLKEDAKNGYAYEVLKNIFTSNSDSKWK